MRTLLLSGAAALSLAAIPFAVIAQDASADASAETSTEVPDPAAPPAQSADEANAAVPPTTDTTVTTRTSGAGQQEVVTTTTSNAAPPPASALDKDYPICRGAVQDSCQNPGEGGAPGRSRALDHWPGAPASELNAAEKAADPSA
jgi:hypothetical protein